MPATRRLHSQLLNAQPLGTKAYYIIETARLNKSGVPKSNALRLCASIKQCATCPK